MQIKKICYSIKIYSFHSSDGDILKKILILGKKILWIIRTIICDSLHYNIILYLFLIDKIHCIYGHTQQHQSLLSIIVTHGHSFIYLIAWSPSWPSASLPLFTSSSLMVYEQQQPQQHDQQRDNRRKELHAVGGVERVGA